MKKSLVDALVEFMCEPDGLTEEELTAELESAGIDVNELRKRVAELVKALTMRQCRK